MELTFASYSPPSAAEIFGGLGLPGLELDQVPPDPWPQGFTCCVWVRDRSSRGVILSREGDTFTLGFLPFGIEEDWQLGLELAGVLNQLCGGSLQREGEPCALEDLIASAEADRAAYLEASYASLGEFVAGEGVTTIPGFTRDTFVGPRLLSELGEGLEGAERLAAAIRVVTYAGDGYHSEQDVLPSDDSEQALPLAVVAPEIPFLLPSVSLLALVGPESVERVSPELVYALLGSWVRRIDEERVYLAALSSEQHAELRAACQGASLDPPPAPISEGWGQPPAPAALAPLDWARQGLRLQEARYRVAPELTRVNLAMALEDVADLLSDPPQLEESFAPYTEAIRHWAALASQSTWLLSRLGLAYAKRAESSLALDRVADALSDFERGAEILARAAPHEESALHPLLIVSKTLVNGALSRDDGQAVLATLAPLFELEELMDREQRALLVLLRGQARAVEDEDVEGLADLVTACQLLAEEEAFAYSTPGEVAYLADRLMDANGITFSQEQRTQLIAVSKPLILRYTAQGWLDPAQAAQTCARWMCLLNVDGADLETIALSGELRQLLASLDSGEPTPFLAAAMAQVCSKEATAYDNLGRRPEARAALARALELAEGIEDVEIRAAIEIDCAGVYLDALDPDRALELIERVAQGEAAWRESGRSGSMKGDALLLLEDFEGAIESFQALFEFAEHLPNPVLVEGARATTTLGLGEVELARGRPEAALPHLEQAVAVFERHMLLEEIQFGEGLAIKGYRALGEVRFLLGDPEGAEKAWRAHERLVAHAKAQKKDYHDDEAELAAARARCSTGTAQEEHFDRARGLLRLPEDALRCARITAEQAERAPNSAVAAAACEAALRALSQLAELTPYARKIGHRLCAAAKDQPLGEDARALWAQVEARVTQPLE